MGSRELNQLEVAKVTHAFGTDKTGISDGETVSFRELWVGNIQLRARKMDDGSFQLKVRWFPHPHIPYLILRNWTIYNKPKYQELLELLEPYFRDLPYILTGRTG